MTGEQIARMVVGGRTRKPGIQENDGNSSEGGDDGLRHAQPARRACLV